MRCSVCNKKIPFVFQAASTCRCGKIVCAKHKSEASHQCTFDWKKFGHEQLSNKLIIKNLLSDQKIQRI